MCGLKNLCRYPELSIKSRMHEKRFMNNTGQKEFYFLRHEMKTEGVAFG
ncbi:MAG: hypothetical protein HW390_202 [Candidatus Brocadiaceae bacterium]|nr:hypothetical protein [Candidatus Brocadiaceae bacterium]